MMLSSTELLARVREFRDTGGNIDERIDALVLRGPFADAPAQAAWLALCQTPPAPISNIQIHDRDIGGDLTANDDFDESRSIIITIEKPVSTKVGWFFFQDSLDGYLRSPEIVAKLVIADLPIDAGFSARGLIVTSWNWEGPIEPPSEAAVICPTRLVLDYVPQRELVVDLSPWIALVPPVQPSVAYKNWQDIATRRMLGGLVSSAWLDDGVIWFQASGPPVFRIRADDSRIVTAWAILTHAVTWVYLSGLDTEARHRLFSGELARADRPDQRFPDTLQRLPPGTAALP